MSFHYVYSVGLFRHLNMIVEKIMLYVTVISIPIKTVPVQMVNGFYMKCIK